MKVRLDTNFEIPGMHGNELEIKDDATIRDVLGEITRIANGRIEFYRHGSNNLETEDWEVEVNGVPHYACDHQLETPVLDGNLITLRLVVIGGG